jgi:putative heme iron utilization protein
MLAQTGWLPPPTRSAIDNAANAAFFDPTMSDRAVSAPEPPLPQTVRELVRGLDRASLATLLAGENWPYASLVLVALDHDLSPILLMSDLALHSKAIAADDRVSLLFDGTAGLDQPLTGPRVTLLGRAARSHDSILRRRFLARHPDAGMYAGFGDFAFYRVALERAHLVGGFGKISWLSVAELMPAPLAGLAEAEPGIVAHMNQDHAEAIELYATKLLGRPSVSKAGEGWTMTGIDAEGIDLRRGGEVARLGFSQPLSTAGQARQALIDLVGRARAV